MSLLYEMSYLPYSSIPIIGKADAVECGTIPVLLKFLSDPEAELRAEAAGALMT